MRTCGRACPDRASSSSRGCEASGSPACTLQHIDVIDVAVAGGQEPVRAFRDRLRHTLGDPGHRDHERPTLGSPREADQAEQLCRPRSAVGAVQSHATTLAGDTAAFGEQRRRVSVLAEVVDEKSDRRSAAGPESQDGVSNVRSAAPQPEP